VQGEDQEEGKQQELPCPNATPEYQYRQQHQEPGYRRKEQRFEELFQDEHA
jgi:hypothetical protein